MRRVPVAVAASALGAAVLIVAAASGIGTASTAPLPCKSSQLSLAPAGSSYSSALRGGGAFSFTDISSRSCTLVGYPTFSAREVGGRTALQRIEHGGLYGRPRLPWKPGYATQPLLLTPGHSVDFAVGWFSNQPSQYCLDPPTLYVSAAPPGNTRSLVTPFRITGPLCGPVTVGYLAYVIP